MTACKACGYDGNNGETAVFEDGKCTECGVKKALTIPFDKAWGVVKEYTPEDFRDHGDADHEFLSQPDDELEREGSFSKQPCDTCHQDLAGNRYKVTAANRDTEPINLRICEDCLMRLVGGYSWNQKDQVYE